MRALSVPWLLALTLVLDAVIVSSAVPLQRASFEAARTNAPVPVILGLLLANFVLLAVVLLAMYTNGRLVVAIALSSQLRHKIGRGREEVSLPCDTYANASRESAAPPSSFS
jgi:hypothetical protein